MISRIYNLPTPTECLLSDFDPYSKLSTSNQHYNGSKNANSNTNVQELWMNITRNEGTRMPTSEAPINNHYPFMAFNFWNRLRIPIEEMKRRSILHPNNHNERSNRATQAVEEHPVEESIDKWKGNLLIQCLEILEDSNSSPHVMPIA